MRGAEVQFGTWDLDVDEARVSADLAPDMFITTVGLSDRKVRKPVPPWALCDQCAAVVHELLMADLVHERRVG